MRPPTNASRWNRAAESSLAPSRGDSTLSAIALPMVTCSTL
jgi:hypothetical protein